MGNDRLEQLAGLAGRADDQALAVAQQLRLRHTRKALEILQMGVGNDVVEVAQARLVLGKDDDMAGAAVVDAAAGAQAHHVGVDGLDVLQAPLMEHFGKAEIDFAAGQGIVGSPVMVEFRQRQGLGHQIQLKFVQVRQKILR